MFKITVSHLNIF